MKVRRRIVFDTNALVSRLLIPTSVPAQAVRHAATEDQLIASDATLMELADVLSRRKFDPYVTIAERQQFLRLLGRIVDRVEIIRTVRECRDPKDDKFLELALNGAADVVVTGDGDLLALDPFQGIPILTPARYLARVGAG
jgi:putative PIN family toxin of toxin-antitoxin system